MKEKKILHMMWQNVNEICSLVARTRLLASGHNFPNDFMQTIPFIRSNKFVSADDDDDDDMHIRMIFDARRDSPDPAKQIYSHIVCINKFTLNVLTKT